MPGILQSHLSLSPPSPSFPPTPSFLHTTLPAPRRDRPSLAVSFLLTIDLYFCQVASRSFILSRFYSPHLLAYVTLTFDCLPQFTTHLNPKHHCIMHVNKRIGRFKQWAGERMGGEVKTCQSDDFKAMETEMGVRHEGRCSPAPLIGNANNRLRCRPHSQVYDCLRQGYLQAQ